MANSVRVVFGFSNFKFAVIVLFVFLYFYGIVLAKGVISTLFAIWTPWSLYLAVEKLAGLMGLL